MISPAAVWAAGEELPAVQKLFEELRNRTDVQVVIVSTDEKLSVITRFIAQTHYTFPVIQLSTEAVDKMVGIAGIPRTWMVDASGAVRFEMLGYDPADWPDRVMQQLAALK